MDFELMRCDNALDGVQSDFLYVSKPTKITSTAHLKHTREGHAVCLWFRFDGVQNKKATSSIMWDL